MVVVVDEGFRISETFRYFMKWRLSSSISLLDYILWKNQFYELKMDFVEFYDGGML